MSSKQNLFRPGDIIRERYEILEELGSGGFATTYKAQDLSLGIPVALKVYHRSSFTGQEDALKEAKIAAGLYDLEGIASARDFFGENDIPCIVMEYVKGVSIKDYVREHGRIAGNKMLLLVKPLLKSLIKIHEKGILHRDISADNILLTEDGKLKLIDFGAARFTQKAKDAEYTLIFKRGFAPIEQCSNVGEQGPWTDVYGICATMYYMVTGIIPADSVNRYVDDQMLPLQRIDGIKLNQHEIACISKGLAVRIEDRYDSIALLYADLYGAGANDTLNPLSDHTTLKPAAFRPTETNFTEKLSFLTSKETYDPCTVFATGSDRHRNIFLWLHASKEYLLPEYHTACPDSFSLHSTLSDSSLYHRPGYHPDSSAVKRQRNNKAS